MKSRITLARMVDQLAAEGLVERRIDQSDRRAFQLHLRPGAAAQLAAIEEAVVAVRKLATRGLDRDQVAAVGRGLQQMRDNLSDR